MVFVHGFAEEMNKSRRMVARVARGLAAEGWLVVQRDLDGCGDSSGTFAQASWQTWVDDVLAELPNVSTHKPVVLWCMRAGALLVSSVLAARPDVHLLLWQPVLSGASHLQQFVRLESGARIAGSESAAVERPPLQVLRSGGVTCIGGYEVSSALANGLERAVFDVPEGHRGRVVWLEVSSDEVPTLTLPAQHAIERLRTRGVAVDAGAVSGLPFWQTQEIEDCEPLLEATLAATRCLREALSATRTTATAPADLHVAARVRGDDDEEIVALSGAHGRLWGVVTRPPEGVVATAIAVLIVVGGPQYRVGSHRQFVSLARRLARAGFATLRFDYGGMGDSEGPKTDFTGCGPDVRAALDALAAACPHATRLAVWGLCDAASAAMMFATAEPRVAGIAIANPWVRNATSLAAAQLRHYYLARLAERDFWNKVVRGGLDWRGSAGALLDNLRRTLSLRGGESEARSDDPFQLRMLRGLSSFRGSTLLLLSGRDLTAREFVDHTAANPAWTALLRGARISRVDLPEADHTFSRPQWQRAAEDQTIAWLRMLENESAPSSRASAAVATPQ